MRTWPPTMMSRQARPEDADRIAALHIASWQATYRGELPASFLASQDRGVRAAAWRRQLDEGVTVLLDEHDSTLRGFAACGPARNEASGWRTWEIYNLHVAPGLHGQGLGGRLFDEAARLGRARGADELVLWVVESNLPARRFYERRGMRPDGGRQQHAVGSGHVLEEVRYRMSLTALRSALEQVGMERP